MSLQVFLLAKLHGVGDLVADERIGFETLLSRTLWFSLLGEVVPRALLAELKLSPLLLGGTAGGQFFLVLPEPSVETAIDLLKRVNHEMREATGGRCGCAWSQTENIGNWPDIRKRLEAGLAQATNTPGVHSSFEPFDTRPTGMPFDGLYSELLAKPSVFWSPESPAALHASEGKHSWRFNVDLPSVFTPAPIPKWRRWGLLLADLDDVEGRLTSAQTTEEYLQISNTFQSFVAGELARVAATEEFQGKTLVLTSGGDDFAIAAPWEVLLDLAKEMRRVAGLLFRQLDEQREAGARGVSMAIASAGFGESPTSVYRRASDALETVKASGKNAIYLFGRTLDWPQLQEAAQVKQRMRKLLESYRASPEFLDELKHFYTGRSGTELASARARRRGRSLEKPWQLHRRLRRVLDVKESDAFEKQWRLLIDDLIGAAANGKLELRPSGQVALEWTRLEMGSR